MASPLVMIPDPKAEIENRVNQQQFGEIVVEEMRRVGQLSASVERMETILLNERAVGHMSTRQMMEMYDIAARRKEESLRFLVKLFEIGQRNETLRKIFAPEEVEASSPPPRMSEKAKQVRSLLQKVIDRRISGTSAD